MDHVSEHHTSRLNALKQNLSKCILGKSEEIDLMIVALLANGHVLIEDVPGTGKTILVKALARSMNGQFRRIQCNPDLLPSDITGVSIYHPKEEQFIFKPGPIMANIVLVDEINRATTKTQSALLETMEEKQITVDGIVHPLPKPFLMLATQNPIEFEGTYHLPEAQLDRFMMKLTLGYPDEHTEIQMIKSQQVSHPLVSIEPVIDFEIIQEIQSKILEIHIDDAVIEYALRIIRKTREHEAIFLGASPRATLSFIKAVKAYAFLQSREYVIPDDVKHLAPYVLCHRMILHNEAKRHGNDAKLILQSIIHQITAPIRLEK
jgi:MoxR-like ATPase